MNRTVNKLSLITLSVALLANFYGCHKKQPQPVITDDEPIEIIIDQPAVKPVEKSKIAYSHLAQPLPYNKTDDIWINDNDYYQYGFFGQCTWFAYGAFYGHYGYKPVDLTVNADSFAQAIVETHPGKFTSSAQPVQGKDMCIVFSCSDDWGHTGVVTDFDGTEITYMDGNIMELVNEDNLLEDDAICEYSGQEVYILARNTTHIHIDGQTANWRKVTTSYEKFCKKFPHTVFAIEK